MPPCCHSPCCLLSGADPTAPVLLFTNKYLLSPPLCKVLCPPLGVPILWSSCPRSCTLAGAWLRPAYPFSPLAAPLAQAEDYLGASAVWIWFLWASAQPLLVLGPRFFVSPDSPREGSHVSIWEWNRRSWWPQSSVRGGLGRGREMTLPPDLASFGLPSSSQ